MEKKIQGFVSVGLLRRGEKGEPNVSEERAHNTLRHNISPLRPVLSSDRFSCSCGRRQYDHATQSLRAFVSFKKKKRKETIVCV
jgi:hypothetical protein